MLPRKRFVKHTVKHLDGLCGFVTPTKMPSVLVSCKNDDIYMFHHYNYTMTRCFWCQPVSTDNKVEVFKELINWLQNFNQTLNAIFTEVDDAYAWGIVKK